MKDVITIIKYALKFKKNAVLNMTFNVISIFFALFSFTLAIPFLQILFGKEQLVANPVDFQLTVDSLKHNFFWYLSEIIREDGKLQALIFVSLIMVFATLLKNLFGYLASYSMAPVMNGTVLDFQKKIYYKILSLPIGFFSNEKKGDIMSRASSDIQEIKFAVTNSLEVLARDPIMIIIFLIYLIYFSPSLTVFVLIFMPLMGIIIGKIGKTLKKSSMKGQRKSGEILTSIEETLGGLRIVKAFNAENNLKKRYNKLIAELYVIMNKVTRRNSLSSPLSEFLGTFVVVGIIILGGSMILGDNSTLTGEEFITYIIVFSQILNPAKSISRAFYGIKKGAASIERLNEIIYADFKIPEVEDAVEKNDFTSKIEFKNVSFKYEDEYVLKNINLTIEKGKTVALVGQSGSGKSTLVDLIPRFYDIAEGEILIDGINIKNLKIKDLRNLMGNVNQEAILFNNTITGNIAFSVDKYTDDEIVKASKIANAHDFILQTENGYDTNVGDRGSKLSGGQRQRISIARAVLKNPPIMILDEATSALDTESEKLVQDALNNLMKNRTSIVIAHRLSTIKNADIICVLRSGEIIEKGTHKQLIEQNGAYKKLHDLQIF